MYTVKAVLKYGNKINGFLIADAGNVGSIVRLIDLDDMEERCMRCEVTELAWDSKSKKLIPNYIDKPRVNSSVKEMLKRMGTLKNYTNNTEIIRSQDYQIVSSERYGKLIYCMPMLLHRVEGNNFRLVFSVYNGRQSVDGVALDMDNTCNVLNKYFVCTSFTSNGYNDILPNYLRNVTKKNSFNGMLWNLNMLDNAKERFDFFLQSLAVKERGFWTSYAPDDSLIDYVKSIFKAMNNEVLSGKLI